MPEIADAQRTFKLWLDENGESLPEVVQLAAIELEYQLMNHLPGVALPELIHTCGENP